MTIYYHHDTILPINKCPLHAAQIMPGTSHLLIPFNSHTKAHFHFIDEKIWSSEKLRNLKFTQLIRVFETSMQKGWLGASTTLPPENLQNDWFKVWIRISFPYQAPTPLHFWEKTEQLNTEVFSLKLLPQAEWMVEGRWFCEAREWLNERLHSLIVISLLSCQNADRLTLSRQEPRECSYGKVAEEERLLGIPQHESQCLSYYLTEKSPL